MTSCFIVTIVIIHHYFYRETDNQIIALGITIITMLNTSAIFTARKNVKEDMHVVSLGNGNNAMHIGNMYLEKDCITFRVQNQSSKMILYQRSVDTTYTIQLVIKFTHHNIRHNSNLSLAPTKL